MNDPLDDPLGGELDARLRAAFMPPPASRMEALARRAIAAPTASPRWPWLLAAAALLLVATIFVMRPTRGPEGHDGAQLGAMWAAAFEHAETNGFVGGSCCDPASDFGVACEQKFEVRLEVGGDEVTLYGCYCGLPTGGCVAALAETPQGPCGVFIVPKSCDPGACLPVGKDLCLARRELSSLVIYAVSRSRPTHSLGQFRIAP